MTIFPQRVAVSGNLVLRHIVPDDAALLHQLIEINKDGLLSTLHWPRFINAQADTDAFCASCEAARENRKSATYGVWRDKEILGVVSFNAFDHAKKEGEIGYWFGSAARGQGAATAAVAALIRSFADAGLVHRCIIKCATGNERSRKLAERLGFAREGVLSKSERIGDIDHDQYVYALSVGGRNI